MIIESTNIKRKAIEIVHQKENDLSIDNQLFDFYLNKNQIIIEKLTPKLIYKDFIEDENSDKIFKIICKNAELNPKENFLLILENYQFRNLENIIFIINHSKLQSNNHLHCLHQNLHLQNVS